MPAVAAPAMPAQAAVPDLAPQSCLQCGAALAPGKRFCKQCGKPVGEFAPEAEPAPAASPQQANSPATLSCAHCGAAVAVGKRFCKQCGQPVDSTGAAAQVDPVLERHDGIPAEQSNVLDMPAAMPVATSTNEPDVALPAQDGLPKDWTSAWEPVKLGSQIPASSPLSAAAFGSPEPLTKPFRQSKAKLGLAIGVAAAVLLAAGGVLAWHFYSHRGVSPVAKSLAESQQATVTPPANNPPAATSPVQTPKPTPGIQGHAGISLPKPPPGFGAMTPPSPPSTNTSPVSAQHRDSAVPQLAIAPPPPSTPAPTSAAPRSGTLHYQGPPVPYNGVVVFDHLPQARLKFAFNHQAWSLTLKPNPDGTKKATLVSLVPGYQTSCDLGWEIVE